MHHKHGFTLVELSIVLVIIGLLIGGILVGQSLIESSKINKTISELQQYEIAFKQFKTKFKYLPGDEPASFGFSAVQRNNSGVNYANAADNILNTVYGSVDGGNVSICNSGNSEIAASWLHLSEAQFMKKPYLGCVSNQQVLGSTFPKLTLGGGLGVYGELDGNTYFATSAAIVGGATYAFKGTDGYNVKQTYTIDNKMDDGLPNTGKVQFISATGYWNTSVFYNPYNKCAATNSVNEVYNVGSTGSEGACALRITLDKN